MAFFEKGPRTLVFADEGKLRVGWTAFEPFKVVFLGLEVKNQLPNNNSEIWWWFGQPLDKIEEGKSCGYDDVQVHHQCQLYCEFCRRLTPIMEPVNRDIPWADWCDDFYFPCFVCFRERLPDELKAFYPVVDAPFLTVCSAQFPKLRKARQNALQEALHDLNEAGVAMTLSEGSPLWRSFSLKPPNSDG